MLALFCKPWIWFGFDNFIWNVVNLWWKYYISNAAAACRNIRSWSSNRLLKVWKHGEGAEMKVLLCICRDQKLLLKLRETVTLDRYRYLIYRNWILKERCEDWVNKTGKVFFLVHEREIDKGKQWDGFSFTKFPIFFKQQYHALQADCLFNYIMAE